MSNTPRTDAAMVRMERLDGDIDEVVSADFAKRLEGYLAAAETQLQEAWRQVAEAMHDIDRLTASLTAEVNKAPLSATAAPNLSAGHYVCTCAAGRVLHEKTCATRRPDAGGPHD